MKNFVLLVENIHHYIDLILFCSLKRRRHQIIRQVRVLVMTEYFVAFLLACRRTCLNIWIFSPTLYCIINLRQIGWNRSRFHFISKLGEYHVQNGSKYSMILFTSLTQMLKIVDSYRSLLDTILQINQKAFYYLVWVPEKTTFVSVSVWNVKNLKVFPSE
jgi:hypothetical protein